MKICSRCGEFKEYELFNKNKALKDGFNNYCRECSRLYNREYYQDCVNPEMRKRIYRHKVSIAGWNKAMLDAIKLDMGCLRCNENNPACLDFHHFRGTKEFSIGTAMPDKISKERLCVELDKCLVICANCHRKLHSGILQIEYNLI